MLDSNIRKDKEVMRTDRINWKVRVERANVIEISNRKYRELADKNIGQTGSDSYQKVKTGNKDTISS